MENKQTKQQNLENLLRKAKYMEELYNSDGQCIDKHVLPIVAPDLVKLLAEYLMENNVVIDLPKQTFGVVIRFSNDMYWVSLTELTNDIRDATIFHSTSNAKKVADSVLRKPCLEWNKYPSIDGYNLIEILIGDPIE